MHCVLHVLDSAFLKKKSFFKHRENLLKNMLQFDCHTDKLGEQGQIKKE